MRVVTPWVQKGEMGLESDRKGAPGRLLGPRWNLFYRNVNFKVYSVCENSSWGMLKIFTISVCVLYFFKKSI
jgi:hypothetical protein